ncbi:unnamed protein product [Cyprideis torosa]|uniref:Uncharacterized protein n=1 Tax=Cyprideis torosa TaxID=163714 RepID=A0A7R8ZM48_9CRUS|nr:unnamed protein product [Cyprideis torosa]CAG0894746.1 unnamed protein product [Cyprideis torosa]
MADLPNSTAEVEPVTAMDQEGSADALKKLQLVATKIEAKFYKEVHALECKYAEQYADLNSKRKEIVTGAHEPTEEECDFVSDKEEEEEEEMKLSKDLKEKAVVDAGSGDGKKDEVNPGVPAFWFVVFRNAEMLSEMVMAHDDGLLMKCQDIKVVLDEDPMGFTLEFYFEKNKWINNSVLTKRYEMSCDPDPDDPFAFAGPEIIKCTGCKIDWKPGMNLTQRTVHKKQKHKTGGATRTVTKQVNRDSFFNFFNPPQPNEDGEVDEDVQALLLADFEIGHFLRERVIPRAVLYYTGEALEEDEDEDDLEELGEEEDDDDEDDDDEGESATGGVSAGMTQAGDVKESSEMSGQKRRTRSGREGGEVKVGMSRASIALNNLLKQVLHSRSSAAKTESIEVQSNDDEDEVSIASSSSSENDDSTDSSYVTISTKFVPNAVLPVGTKRLVMYDVDDTESEESLELKISQPQNIMNAALCPKSLEAVENPRPSLRERLNLGFFPFFLFPQHGTPAEPNRRIGASKITPEISSNVNPSDTPSPPPIAEGKELLNLFEFGWLLCVLLDSIV